MDSICPPNTRYWWSTRWDSSLARVSILTRACSTSEFKGPIRIITILLLLTYLNWWCLIKPINRSINLIRACTIWQSASKCIQCYTTQCSMDLLNHSWWDKSTQLCKCSTQMIWLICLNKLYSLTICTSLSPTLSSASPRYLWIFSHSKTKLQCGKKCRKKVASPSKHYINNLYVSLFSVYISLIMTPINSSSLFQLWIWSSLYGKSKGLSKSKINNHSHISH